ncbi:MAG: hypothetical protein Roseis2KO_57770 [Roseivirga sp.]
MNQSLALYVFYTDVDKAKKCIEAGVNGIVIDWERAGKRHRQSLFDTQINQHGLRDLADARELFTGSIVCRVNGGEELGRDEIQRAIDHGADEIMIPMIKSVRQAEEALNLIDGKAKSIIMIETEEAVRSAEEIGKLPLDKVYVGFNDLAISRNVSNIFLPLIDGTMEEISSSLQVEFGFAGLTHPEMGYPLPSILLLNEMKALGASFTLLRRSFFRDMKNYTAKEIIDAIHFEFARSKTNSEVQKKRLTEAVNLAFTSQF